MNNLYVKLNQIEYFGPTSVNSFSGFSKSISEYYPVFFGSDLLTMEHINNKDSINSSVSFKPLKTIDVTFSSIIQPEVASKTYVIKINTNIFIQKKMNFAFVFKL